MREPNELAVGLDDPPRPDPAITGAKAANLARCANAGLDILPGFALTTAGAAKGLDDPEVTEALRTAWQDLGGNDIPLVVRSSSTVEDAGSSSMAGQFTSVLDVVGWEAFLVAVADVLASAKTVASPAGADGAQPMAVLVQRQLDATKGGVMFGVDPVTGERNHLVVEVVPSRPDTLVGGEVTAAHYVLSQRGRLIHSLRATPETELTASQRTRLARLAEHAAAAFDGPQDIEWAVDADDHLWLLQSRPVTAVAATGAAGATSHVFGPGPVAETFPLPLRRLEEAIWVDPLRDGMVRALGVTGAVSKRKLEASPVLTTVGGWAAADLQVLGITQGQRSFRSRISPAEIVRRLGAAARVGRTRVALPTLSAVVLDSVDQHLADVPRLADLDDAALWGVLQDARRELVTAHCYEVLAGMLLTDKPGAIPTGVLALHAVADRHDDETDQQLIARSPVVLSLIPPVIGPRPALPHVAPTTPDPVPGLERLGLRDGLRLRTRWLQELTGSVAAELGRRLAAAGAIASWDLVRELDLAELGAVVAGAPAPAELAERAAVPAGAPLPDTFRLGGAGQLVAADRHKPRHVDGVPAGGGQATGEVQHHVEPGAPRHGVVLVVRHLEPTLAAVLPSVDGLVAETGSALSHLAILAREMGVPTVVGVADALHRFPPGSRVFLDGTTGEVRSADADADADADLARTDGAT